MRTKLFIYFLFFILLSSNINVSGSIHEYEQTLNYKLVSDYNQINAFLFTTTNNENKFKFISVVNDGFIVEYNYCLIYDGIDLVCQYAYTNTGDEIIIGNKGDYYIKIWFYIYNESNISNDIQFTVKYSLEPVNYTPLYILISIPFLTSAILFIRANDKIKKLEIN